MKLNKLAIFVCMFFLLNIVVVLASDMDPIFRTFNADSTNVVVNTKINIMVEDLMGTTNPGILWVKVYEVGTGEIYSEDCGGDTLCAFEVDVSHPEGGVFSYYAIAKDNGANGKTSNTLQITYLGKNVSNCTLVFDPVTPSLYGTPVNASCSCDNPETSAVLSRNGVDVTAAENNIFSVLSANTHDYECSVNETPSYTNATTGTVSYIVDPASTNLTLTASPSWTEVNGTQTTVSCNADNTEVNVELYRNGSLVSNPDVQTLTNGTYVYDCNATASQNYTAPTLVSNNLKISLVPPVYVLWNNPSLNMGTAFQGFGVIMDLENITATGNNTNVNVACVSGDCGVIADLWTDGTNMTDGENQTVYFNCDTTNVGNYLAVFEVDSTEDSTVRQIMVSCGIIPIPPVKISWDSFGPYLIGTQGTGPFLGTDNITSTGNNTNVTVTCDWGDCAVITDDWIDGTNMTDNESQTVNFTCNDSIVGIFEADFLVTSNEDPLGDSINVDCDVDPPIVSTGNVLINEFLAQNSTGNDWIELYNNDTNQINLTGWSMNDSTSAMITTPSMDGIILYPGDIVLFYVGSRLNLGGDTITLLDSASTVIDTYTYTSSQLDVSIGRYPDGTNNWLNMTTPTPGDWNRPDVYIAWNTDWLPLVGGQGASISGSVNLNSVQNNTNVVVTCNLGDCAVIADDWIDGTNMTDGETQPVTFTCDSTNVGFFEAEFLVTSTEGPVDIYSYIDVECDVNLIPIYSVSLTDPADLFVDNATDAVYTITITNTGNVADIYNLTFNNIDIATTANLNQTTVSLGPGASSDFTLTVGDPTVGTYNVNVTATSQTNITSTDEIDTLTTVSAAPVYGVNIVSLTVNQQVSNTQTAVYDLQVTNTGNQPDTFDLTVNNLDTADTATLNTYTLSLNAGVSTTVQLSVADSTPGLYDVTVTATSQTQPTTTDTSSNIQTDVIQAIGSLSGTVTDGTNPLYQVLVELRQGASVIDSTLTAETGGYSFSNIDIGTYDVVVIKAGFNNDITSDTINEASNTVHDVTLTPAAFAGSISGTLLDGTDGTTPISGAPVLIIRSDTSEIVQIIQTGVSGNYVFNGLPPTVGFTYSLEVTPVPPPYTTVFPPSGLSLTSGQSRTGENIYLI